MIAIVDYGAGNLRSVELALARLGVHTRVTADPDMLALADGLILPGVGAFSDAMAALGRSGTIPAVLEAVGAGRPLLGICLGSPERSGACPAAASKSPIWAGTA